MKCICVLALLSVSAFSSDRFDWQGHRGARGLYPENTIGGMEEALKWPVTTLEMDVVISKDHQVVVSHDPYMNPDFCLDPQGNRIKNKNIILYKLTYDEIIKYDCGSVPYPKFPRQKKVKEGKPLLEKLFLVIEPELEELNRKSLSYDIEIKSTVEDEKAGYQPDYKTFSDLVIKTIKKHLSVERFTIQSFDWRVLKYLHGAYPDIRLVALTEEKIHPEEDLKRLGFTPYVFAPDYSKLNPSHVDYFHSQKVLVIPWTVNDLKDMRNLIDMKVDGIITDYPDLIPSAEKNCKKGTFFFENNCVIVPEHAVPSKMIPGWECQYGYFQKRMKCKKIPVPKNAHLTFDGKSWECHDGFKRYRDTCKK